MGKVGWPAKIEAEPAWYLSDWIDTTLWEECFPRNLWCFIALYYSSWCRRPDHLMWQAGVGPVYPKGFIRQSYMVDAFKLVDQSCGCKPAFVVRNWEQPGARHDGCVIKDFGRPAFRAETSLGAGGASRTDSHSELMIHNGVVHVARDWRADLEVKQDSSLMKLRLNAITPFDSESLIRRNSSQHSQWRCQSCVREQIRNMHTENGPLEGIILAGAPFHYVMHVPIIATSLMDTSARLNKASLSSLLLGSSPSTFKLSCPCSLTSSSFNCLKNPSFGVTIGRANTIRLRASNKVKPCRLIRYAVTTVGDREIPAAQCTRTAPRLDASAASMNDVASRMTFSIDEDEESVRDTRL